MKRFLLGAFILGLVLALAWILLPIPLPGDHGEYNTITRLVWCDSERACLHEHGHALDHDKGWISQSDDFGKALEIYTLGELVTGKPARPARLAYEMLFWPLRRWGWNPRAEIYAELYADAGGDINKIPVGLRDFYKVQECVP